MTDEDRIADLEADLIKANNQIAELKESQVIKCYNCDYKGEMTSLGWFCRECHCNN